MNGYAVSSRDFSSLHDVYEGADDSEACQKNTYMLQFLWRDMTSDVDVIGPYFTLSSTIESQSLYSVVTYTMLAFSKYGFNT
jgi:hypothetical protein